MNNIDRPRFETVPQTKQLSAAQIEKLSLDYIRFDNNGLFDESNRTNEEKVLSLFEGVTIRDVITVLTEAEHTLQRQAKNINIAQSQLRRALALGAGLEEPIPF